ncbi:hypothetical protein ABPG72_013878 [Tetrahymena utriculariae]
MDQIVYTRENQEILESSFEFSYEGKTYIISLQVIDHMIEISVILEEQTSFQWKDLFSIEQIYKLQNFFLQFTSLQKVYEIFSKLMKNCIKSITKSDNKMQIQLEFEQILDKIQFFIELHQCEINTDQIVVKLCEKISEIETKTNKQFEQLVKDQQTQTEQIKDYLAKQIEQMKEFLVGQIQSLKVDHQNQIQEIKKKINQIEDKIQFNNIFLKEELEMIKQWIEMIYERCKDKRKVIFFIKTIENKRFGFYADCQIKNYSGNFLAQNPNNIFLFSLDLKKKYTSNEINNSNAFYSNNQLLAVGGGFDIKLYTNSNTTKDNYVDAKSYGKKEGINKYDLNGGIDNYTTSEVEIFEIIDG